MGRTYHLYPRTVAALGSSFDAAYPATRIPWPYAPRVAQWAVWQERLYGGAHTAGDLWEVVPGRFHDLVGFHVALLVTSLNPSLVPGRAVHSGGVREPRASVTA